MRDGKIRVMVKAPGKDWEPKTIDNTLEALQQEVGGYIQFVPCYGVAGGGILCNEEGRLMGLERNCLVEGVSYCGSIVYIGARPDREDFEDCPEELPEWGEWG